MPVIYAQNFAGGTQQYLTLGANGYQRTLGIGANWTRLRIGILCNIGTVQGTTYDIFSPSLCIGVCSGIRSSVGLYAPAHCAGFGTPAIPGMTTYASSMVYTAGSGGNSYWASAAWNFYVTSAGTAVTSSAGVSQQNFPTNASAIPRRGIWILDLSKSALVSGTLSQGVQGGAVAHMSLDITSSDLYTALETYYVTPTIQGTALQNLALGNAIAFNETTYGSLDTVEVFWSHYTIPFNLFEIAVYRLG